MSVEKWDPRRYGRSPFLIWISSLALPQVRRHDAYDNLARSNGRIDVGVIRHRKAVGSEHGGHDLGDVVDAGGEVGCGVGRPVLLKY